MRRFSSQQARERHLLSLACICSLCFLHLHRGNAHACLACADSWFRAALNLPRPHPPTGTGTADQFQPEGSGYMKLLECALASRDTAATGAHVAVHVAEALCMCRRPFEAADCLTMSLAWLQGLRSMAEVRFQHLSAPVEPHTPGSPCQTSALFLCGPVPPHADV